MRDILLGTAVTALVAGFGLTAANQAKDRTTKIGLRVLGAAVVAYRLYTVYRQFSYMAPAASASLRDAWSQLQVRDAWSQLQVRDAWSQLQVQVRDAWSQLQDMWSQLQN